jgi:hypothetical protein
MDTMGSWEAIGRRKRVKVASLQSLFGEKEHIPLSWEEEEKKTKQIKNQEENLNIYRGSIVCECDMEMIVW